MCEMLLNEQLNGVELYFDSKPIADILQRLKDNKFRWNNLKKCWYAKQNEKTLQLANELSNNKIENQILNEVSNTITFKESFYPDYDMVDGIKIYKTSEDVEILNFQSGYFADINCFIHFYCDSCCITDLTNALSTGKVCTTYNLNHLDWKRESIALPLYNDNNIKTIKDLYNFIISEKEPINFKIQKSEKKSIKTFSPFVQIKPIKTPNKWTITHVWKAILSGQIYKAETNYHYTDDYAYDNATNFSEGRGVHLPTLAKDIIESSSSGLSVYKNGEQKEDGTIMLNFNTYSFDSKTLYYNEKCNIKEAEFRRLKEIENLKNYNENLLSQVLDLKESDIIPNSIYNISYLKMNDNTKKYEVITELKFSNCLFYEDENDYSECRYKITEISRYIPENRTLYSISNFHNRPYGDKYNDKRIIDMGNWEHIVTGYALKELLAEGYTFATVRKSEYSNINKAKEKCTKHINGTLMWIFGSDKTDYKQSLYRLNAEEIRIKDDDECLVL